MAISLSRCYDSVRAGGKSRKNQMGPRSGPNWYTDFSQRCFEFRFYVNFDVFLDVSLGV